MSTAVSPTCTLRLSTSCPRSATTRPRHEYRRRAAPPRRPRLEGADRGGRRGSRRRRGNAGAGQPDSVFGRANGDQAAGAVEDLVGKAAALPMQQLDFPTTVDSPGRLNKLVAPPAAARQDDPHVDVSTPRRQFPHRRRQVRVSGNEQSALELSIKPAQDQLQRDVDVGLFLFVRDPRRAASAATRGLLLEPAEDGANAGRLQGGDECAVTGAGSGQPRRERREVVDRRQIVAGREDRAQLPDVEPLQMSSTEVIDRVLHVETIDERRYAHPPSPEKRKARGPWPAGTAGSSPAG